MGDAAAKVKSIFVYPIKSCRGISVAYAPISATGFRWDRQWMVVNANGRMYTQRVEPKLALVEVELPSEAFSEGWELSSNSYMVVNAPGMDLLKVCLSKPRDMIDHVSVWEWNGSAFDEGAEAAQWFSKFLGKTSRLVRFDPVSQTRNTDPDYARGYRTMFADLFPFMLASQESLDALNKILKEPIPINRFRPNLMFAQGLFGIMFLLKCHSILVEGCQPFAEDLWKDIKINKITFSGVRLCSRCKVPTVNQGTGVLGSEPTETLKSFRSDKVLLPNKRPKGQVYFGQNLVCKDCFAGGTGKIIQVGDPIHVMQQVSSAAEAAV